MSRLTSLGFAQVYSDPKTGEFIVDQNSFRRGSFAGDDDFGDDDDDFGDDDDDFGDDDDDFGDDDEFGDDDDDFGDEFGARRKKKRKLWGRNKRDERPPPGRSGGRRAGKRKKKGGSKVTWGTTALTGNATLTAAGPFTIPIRLQHSFRSKDFTFEGTTATGAKITSIYFGDRSVWSASNGGVPVSVFGTNSTIRNLLGNQKISAGLDITVNGTAAGAGDVVMTMIGSKPMAKDC